MTQSNTITRGVFAACLIGAALLAAWAPAEDTINVEIEVAPNVLNLLNNGQVVTVHTDLAYGTVDAWTVYLNGIQISAYKSDNRGDFVAKFPIEEVKDLDLAIGAMNSLVFTGQTKDRTLFRGEAEILVVSKGSGK